MSTPSALSEGCFPCLEVIFACGLTSSSGLKSWASGQAWGLEAADGLDPLNGYGLFYWLQGGRPWSQFVSMEDFVDAAREPHRSRLRTREMQALKAMDALDSPLRLALTGLPVTEPLAPRLQHALDRLVKAVDNIIASIEVQERRPDGW